MYRHISYILSVAWYTITSAKLQWIHATVVLGHLEQYNWIYQVATQYTSSSYHHTSTPMQVW